MLIVYWPITIKFRIRKQTSKTQIYYRCCLQFSFLASYWLISRNTITFHKYFWCSRFCEFHIKTVHPFRNFLAVLPPTTLCKVETRKKFWIHASNIDCGVRGGVGKRPRNAKVSQDFCPRLSEKEMGRKKAVKVFFRYSDERS